MTDEVSLNTPFVLNRVGNISWMMMTNGEVFYSADEINWSPVSSEPILQFFNYAHLPSALQEIAKPFLKLAVKMILTLPSSEERTTALRKLLEAKDCAVRAKLYKEL